MVDFFKVIMKFHGGWQKGCHLAKDRNLMAFKITAVRFKISIFQGTTSLVCMP